ncbi:MAG TPA: hypothetical protein VGS59_12930 [Candidatus Acidoferrales bacterium]|nr:hypothetical protein [Candidatus Acidoferrales bacterium]
MAPDKPQVSFEPVNEMFEAYANNVFYESSAWDLKLIFGQLDQRDGVKIVQHSAITLPWPLVKLMVYWLRGQIEYQERLSGKIEISPLIIPPEIPPLTEEARKQDPKNEVAYEIFSRTREEFLESLKK